MYLYASKRTLNQIQKKTEIVKLPMELSAGANSDHIEWTKMKLGNYLSPHLNGSRCLAQLLTASLKWLVIVLIFVCKLDREIACPLHVPLSLLPPSSSLTGWTGQITQSLGHYSGASSRVFARSQSVCRNIRRHNAISFAGWICDMPSIHAFNCSGLLRD